MKAKYYKNGNLLETEYEVTEEGIVSRYNKPLKSHLDSSGYRKMALFINKKRVNAFLHRILASTFIDIPKYAEEVNHIDGNKLNNSISNLEWCTKKYNRKHAFRIGLQKIIDTKGEKNGNRKLSLEDILYIRSFSNRRYPGLLRVLANKYNVSRSHISSILNNKYWKQSVEGIAGTN